MEIYLSSFFLMKKPTIFHTSHLFTGLFVEEKSYYGVLVCINHFGWQIELQKYFLATQNIPDQTFTEMQLKLKCSLGALYIYSIMIASVANNY